MNRRNFLVYLTGLVSTRALPCGIQDFKTRLIRQYKKSDYSSLKNTLGDLNPGDLTIIAGRPSMGKTAYLLQLMLAEAGDKKKRIVLFNPESSETEILSRLTRIKANMSQNEAKSWNLNHQTGQIFANAIHDVRDLKFHIVSRGSISIEDIRYKLKILKSQTIVDLAIVDGMQLIESEKSIMQELKNLAQEFSIPVIATSGVWSVVDNRKNKRPKLKDLIGPCPDEIRECASRVVTIFRPDYYKQTYKNQLQEAELSTFKPEGSEAQVLKKIWDEELGKFQG